MDYHLDPELSLTQYGVISANSRCLHPLCAFLVFKTIKFKDVLGKHCPTCM